MRTLLLKGVLAVNKTHIRQGSSSSDLSDSGGAVGTRVPAHHHRRGSLSSLEATEQAGVLGTSTYLTPASKYASQPYLTQSRHLSRRHVLVVPRPRSLGSLEFSLRYEVNNHGLLVTVYRARNIQSTDSSGLSDPFVTVELVPPLIGSKVSVFRTKTSQRTANPEFHESIAFHNVMETDMSRTFVRFVILDEDRGDALGELKVPLVRLKPNFTQMFNSFLDPPAQLSVSEYFSVRDGNNKDANFGLLPAHKL
ncbi:unnamed protein product [Notodromas monacha]|uniref:C2 domain-containing protein n=1 Tax=Notodromas monacha TaxID=399045 RepID=A0A7R9GB86_9CRUS|nr:unnamed protein product [Notodromas monacha]CAG0914811.1 unnamed protein product [Notodromas monacha]